mmetsp:Transcript_5018/g.8350  ORF Transcript_5018/g.8350 Transcript_5018/m.8350 type:complete len:260 (-) Transcript_5018:1190-1969(-)
MLGRQDELVVSALLRHEFIMRALLNQIAPIEHHDLVRVANGRQAVRNDEGGHGVVGEQLIERRLHDTLRIVIECRCRFVEKQDLGVFDHGASDGHPLLLAARQLSGTASSNVRIITLGKLHNEVVGVRHLGRMFDLLLRRARLPTSNVLADGARKEDRLLADERNLLAEPVDVKLLEVDAVKRDAARLRCVLVGNIVVVRVVKPFYQLHGCRLAAAAGADEGHGRACLDGDGEVLVDRRIRARRVGEGDVLELDLPLDI